MIERLYVQNFRCLESLTLDFSGKSSVLFIGGNGAGKSTVLCALSKLQSICRGSSRSESLLSRKDFSLNRTDRPMRFELDARIDGKLYSYLVSFEWPDSFREARILDESLKVDGLVVFDRKLAQVELSHGVSFSLDWHVFALPVINDRPPARSTQDFKMFLASLALISPIPANMSGFSEKPTVELKSDASNFASCLRDLLEKKPASYGEYDKYVRTMISDFSFIEHVPRGKDGIQLMVTFNGARPEASLSVEFDALSDGEKCFFLSAYIFASTSSGIPIVCMWDEPDSHLSLAEVGQFIMAMRKTAKMGGQFIVTSHHPETVRKFSDDTTFVLTRKSHLEPTLVHPLSTIKYNGDLIEALIRNEVIG